MERATRRITRSIPTSISTGHRWRPPTSWPGARRGHRGGLDARPGPHRPVRHPARRDRGGGRADRGLSQPTPPVRASVVVVPGHDAACRRRLHRHRGHPRDDVAGGVASRRGTARRPRRWPSPIGGRRRRANASCTPPSTSTEAWGRTSRTRSTATSCGASRSSSCCRARAPSWPAWVPCSPPGWQEGAVRAPSVEGPARCAATRWCSSTWPGATRSPSWSFRLTADPHRGHRPRVPRLPGRAPRPGPGRRAGVARHLHEHPEHQRLRGPFRDGLGRARRTHRVGVHPPRRPQLPGRHHDADGHRHDHRGPGRARRRPGRGRGGGAGGQQPRRPRHRDGAVVACPAPVRALHEAGVPSARSPPPPHLRGHHRHQRDRCHRTSPRTRVAASCAWRPRRCATPSTTPASAASEVDGLVTFAADTNPEIEVARTLGMGDLTFFSRIHYGGGAACATVHQAAMAVASGVADVVVCYRAFNERSGHRFGTGVQGRAPVRQRRERPLRVVRPPGAAHPGVVGGHGRPALPVRDRGHLRGSRTGGRRRPPPRGDQPEGVVLREADHPRGAPGVPLDRRAVASARLLPGDRRWPGHRGHQPRAGPRPPEHRRWSSRPPPRGRGRVRT